MGVALEIALKALNLKKNDHIIVTPRSFIIRSCVCLGLKLLFADVNLNGNCLEELKNYTKKVKAIILVHLVDFL